jgi:hypothetical protein
MEDEVILPFTIPSVYGGFAVAEGLARLRRDGLLLECEVSDSVAGIFRSGLKRIRIPLEAIASVEVRKRWWRTSLVLRVKTLRVIEELPGGRHGEILLQVRRRDRREAERFATALEGYLTEAALEQLERENESAG